MAGPTVRLDLRAVLPVAALVVVVLVIVFVELCGREDVAPIDQPAVSGPQPGAPLAPTFTPGPSPTGVTGEPTAPAVQPGGEARDETRVQDLADLQQALEQYREENGAYPNTDGNVQTLCAFLDADAGCELQEVLSSLPGDPLGNPGANGYWYASTGRRFTLYAQRESEAFPSCDEHPEHLANLDSLLCVTGP